MKKHSRNRQLIPILLSMALLFSQTGFSVLAEESQNFLGGGTAQTELGEIPAEPVTEVPPTPTAAVEPADTTETESTETPDASTEATTTTPEPTVPITPTEIPPEPTPAEEPTETPTIPTATPTVVPTGTPIEPTAAPTVAPTDTPDEPSPTPSAEPTATPTVIPSEAPAEPSPIPMMNSAPMAMRPMAAPQAPGISPRALPMEYKLTVDVRNGLTFDENDSETTITVPAGQDYTGTIQATEGYALPDTCIWEANDRISGTLNIDADSGSFTIPADLFLQQGDLEIIVKGLPVYTITYNLTNLIPKDPETLMGLPDGGYQGTLTANDGCILPEKITWTGANGNSGTISLNTDGSFTIPEDVFANNGHNIIVSATAEAGTVYKVTYREPLNDAFEHDTNTYTARPDEDFRVNFTLKPGYSVLGQYRFNVYYKDEFGQEKKEAYVLFSPYPDLKSNEIKKFGGDFEIEITSESWFDGVPVTVDLPESPVTYKDNASVTVHFEFSDSKPEDKLSDVRVVFFATGESTGYSRDAIRNEDGSYTADISTLPPNTYSTIRVDYQYGSSHPAVETEKTLTVLPRNQSALTFENTPSEVTYGDKLNVTVTSPDESEDYTDYRWIYLSSDNKSVLKRHQEYVAEPQKGTATFDTISAGTANIIAEKEGNEKYNPVTATHSVTVKPKELTIENLAVQAKQYDGTTAASFITEPTLKGIIPGDKVELTYDETQLVFTSASTGKQIPVTLPTFTLTGRDAGNYTLAPLPNITAEIYNRYNAQKGSDYTVNSNDWLNEDFVITAAENREISTGNTLADIWTDQLTVSEETDNGSFTFYVRNKETGAISLEVTEQYKIDKTAPTGTLTFGDKSWTDFRENIPFDSFHAKAQTALLSAEDTLSGVKTIEYALSEQALTLEKLATLNWTAGTEVTVSPQDKKTFVVYARITDNAGNVSFLSTDGWEFDLTAPVINGLEDGREYCISADFTVTEKNLQEVQIDGALAEASEEGVYTLTPGEHTILVADKAGNTAEIKVTLYETHVGGEATCTEKAICRLCQTEYGETDPANHTNLVETEEKPATHLAAGNMAYWHCDGCAKYFSDEAGTKEIALEDTVLDKLLEHTPDETSWHTDEASHWKTCACGEILEKNTHEFQWVIDKEATEEECGSKHEECGICGYKKDAVEIPVIVKPTTPPAEPTDTPVKPTDTPAEPTGTPAEPTDTPAKPTDTPVKPTDTPAEPTGTPAEPTDTPAKPTDTPVKPTGTPTGTPAQTSPTPTEPGKDDSGQDTDKPSPTKPGVPNKDTDKSTPKTGDETNVAFWILLTLASGGVCAALYLTGKRKKYKK